MHEKERPMHHGFAGSSAIPVALTLSTEFSPFVECHSMLRSWVPSKYMFSPIALVLSSLLARIQQMLLRPVRYPLARSEMINDRGSRTTATERLLIPIGRSGGSAGSIQYAIRRARMGGSVETCLLHVEEPVPRWELPETAVRPEATLRRQIEYVLSQATRPLAERGIPYAAYLRSGDVVFSILDAAEELACQQIVVPLPRSRWRRLFSHDVVVALYARQRDIPVVAVTEDGMPMDSSPFARC